MTFKDQIIIFNKGENYFFSLNIFLTKKRFRLFLEDSLKKISKIMIFVGSEIKG